MKEFLGSVKINKDVLGFGDELMLLYDDHNAELTISIFEDNHYQDEVCIDLGSAIMERLV